MRIYTFPFKVLFLSIILLGSFISLTAGPTLGASQLIRHELLFEENRGQLSDEHGNLLTDIKYYGRQNGVAVYLENNNISFVFTKTPAHKTIAGKRPDKYAQIQDLLHDTMQAARMELAFLNANPHPQIISEDKQEATNNYFLAQTGMHGITGVNSFKKITYKDIYPHIDLILNANTSGLEYSFLVHPGGNVNDINLQWNGTDQNSIADNGGNFYTCSLGNIKESSPHSYVDGHIISSSFQSKQGNSYGFNIANYDRTKDLLIDPSLVWGTYYGGSVNEICYGICTDTTGNVYISGFTKSSAGMATSGAYITSYTGGSDAYMAEFSGNGKLIWATYFGGSGDDVANNIRKDISGNIYIAGTTTSSNIATSGAYQTSIGGSYDAYLAKFSSSGGLLWSTYYGGSGDETGSGINIDVNGNIFFTGSTSSTSGIATSGAYQTTNAGGLYDAFLAKFSSSGSLSWATYYGGTKTDEPYDLSIDASGYLYLTGYTNSSNGIASSGAYKTSNSGNNDIFLAKFSNSGSLSWATYYGGTGTDYGYGICNDASSNIYLVGSTNSPKGIATSGAYQTSYPASSFENDAFLAKFSSSGTLSWATYYGGTDYDNGNAICLDVLGNIYITGDAESYTGIATTGAYKTYCSGLQDAFLAKFNPSGNLKWATYYGGSGYDISHCVATDPFGNIYFGGQTESGGNIATSGAYQSSYAGSIDNFLVKFFIKTYQNDAGIDSVKAPSTIICDGHKRILVHLQNYGLKPLKSVDIHWMMNDTPQTTYAWTGTLAPGASTTIIIDSSYNFTYAGIYKLTAYTRKPNGIYDTLSSNDSVIYKLRARAIPFPHIGKDTAICVWDNASFGVPIYSGISYLWASNPGGYNSTNNTVFVTPKVTTTYYLKEIIDSTGCYNYDSIKVTVNPWPSPGDNGSQIICKGDSVAIGLAPKAGYTYQWTSSSTGFKSTLANPVVKPSSTAYYTLKQIVTATGCKSTDSLRVLVRPLPVPKLSAAQSICNGDSTTISVASVSGDTYSWTSNPIGFKSTSLKNFVKPSATTYYIVKEITKLSACHASDSVKITVNPRPAANVGTNINVCYGKYITIGATPVSGNTYYWSSDPIFFTSTSANPSVNPITTTVFSLKETITATGCSDSNTIKVTVNPLPKAAWLQKSKSANYYFYVQDSSLSPGSYSWDFNDGTTAIGYHVNHTFAKSKYYTIKLAVTNTFGCTLEHDSAVYVTISGITPENNADAYNIDIYPNPFRDKTIIHFNNPEIAQVKVKIMDMQGRILYAPAGKSFKPGTNEIEINSVDAGLAPGTYFVTIMMNDWFITKKIVELK